MNENLVWEECDEKLLSRRNIKEIFLVEKCSVDEILNQFFYHNSVILVLLIYY